MIQFQKQIPVSRDKLWSALTELDQMRQWYFKELKDFEPEVGFETSFTFEYQGKKFTHQWRVYEVLPLDRISYHWKYQEYEGDSIVSFELEEAPQGVLLRLEAHILKPFPPLEEFSQKNMEEGWRNLIEDRLTPFLIKKNLSN
ncbi:MAG: SRPBCC domain-containing protein [Flavobacteriaceae bacterium]